MQMMNTRLGRQKDTQARAGHQLLVKPTMKTMSKMNPRFTKQVHSTPKQRCFGLPNLLVTLCVLSMVHAHDPYRYKMLEPQTTTLAVDPTGSPKRGRTLERDAIILIAKYQSVGPKGSKFRGQIKDTKEWITISEQQTSGRYKKFAIRQIGPTPVPVTPPTRRGSTQVRKRKYKICWPQKVFETPMLQKIATTEVVKNDVKNVSVEKGDVVVVTNEVNVYRQIRGKIIEPASKAGWITIRVPECTKVEFTEFICDVLPESPPKSGRRSSRTNGAKQGVRKITPPHPSQHRRTGSGGGKVRSMGDLLKSGQKKKTKKRKKSGSGPSGSVRKTQSKVNTMSRETAGQLAARVLQKAQEAETKKNSRLNDATVRKLGYSTLRDLSCKIIRLPKKETPSDGAEAVSDEWENVNDGSHDEEQSPRIITSDPGWKRSGPPPPPPRPRRSTSSMLRMQPFGPEQQLQFADYSGGETGIADVDTHPAQSLI